MLCVPTFVAPSPIQGVGLFTATPLRRGTVIWEFSPDVDWKIPAVDLTRFPDPYRAWLLRYLYREPDGTYVLCGDNGKYMNHSFDPNCDDGNGPETIAKRDIAEGEELTCDYRLFDMDSAQNGMNGYR